MGLTIVASEEVVASDQGEAQTMLRGKSNVYRSMGVSCLGIVASPAVTRRILYVCSGIGLRGESTRAPSGDTVCRPGAYGVASIEGLLGFRLLIDDIDDTSQCGVTDAHGSGTLEYLDVRYSCHPCQGSRLPKSVALVTHPIGEYYRLVEATKEEHVEAPVVLEGMDTWERLHGLSGIGVAEQADLLQRKDVGSEGDLPSRGGDLDYGVGSGDTGSTDDDLLDILHTI
jgi:hypothetical protein